MRALEYKKLLTIITPRELKRLIVESLRARGVGGYTIVPATGAGAFGVRAGLLDGDSSIVIYVILSEPRLLAVLEDIDALMRNGYRLKALVQDIAILPRKPLPPGP